MDFLTLIVTAQHCKTNLENWQGVGKPNTVLLYPVTSKLPLLGIAYANKNVS